MWLSRDNYQDSNYILWDKRPRSINGNFHGKLTFSLPVEEFEKEFTIRLKPKEIIKVNLNLSKID